MKLKFLQVFVILLCISKISFAQVSVTFPSDRVVFQRDNSNQAVLAVAGFFSGCVDRVEARFVPRVAGQGTQTPADGSWAVIQNNPVGGNFYGTMPVSGGWYKLEVRAILDNNPVGTSSVEHVGVGEVFVVAGQSNATGGDDNPNGPGSTDDRVNSVNFQNFNANGYSGIAPYSELKLPCPEFVHLDAETKTAPFGNYAWCWGAFGDKMVQKLQVPVMIFNAGWSSTGIKNWQETINPNGVTTSEFSYTFPTGLPFGHMRVTLNNYVAQLGVRAILWHQGETDNLANRTRVDYLKDIRDVIQASRDLSGKSNLAWVVARVSRFNVGGSTRTWQPVIDAQNDVIGIGSNGADPAYKLPGVFAGPETDPFYDINYRRDQVHFSGPGLISLADWWAEKLNTDFFAQSTPYSATPPPNVSVFRSETADVTLNAPNGWLNYNWLSANNCNNTLSGNQQWTSSSGDFKLKVTDNLNNTVFSPALRIPANTTPTAIAKNNDLAQQVIYNAKNKLLGSDCRIIATIAPQSNSGLINGTLTTKTIIDATPGTYLNNKYLQRHFDLKTDRTNLNSKVVIYALQSEFDAYNVNSNIQLPKNPTDQTGKDNLRVVQFQGTSSNGSLGSYNGSRTDITPSGIIWNATLNSWEISFDMNAAGGFFVSVNNNALPVTLTRFSGSTNGKSVSLEWATSSEVDASHFVIERSSDAINFDALGKVIAAGDSHTEKQYNYLDSALPTGLYYYRLKQVDRDESFEFSRIIGVKVESGLALKIFPNPVKDFLTVQSEIEINSVEIFNSAGVRLNSVRVKSNFYSFDMTNYPTGLYLVKINDQVYKIVKN
ncbi:T9SS type A sorting domain-containing protein [Dyadobacter sp. CY345]|uniref:T9SS type A sorting domain-containing protein n=1 Tax=Dyadobacter sp. CY345 TaxID=2909335 RepID=UPI001F4675F3|nr:T9SS type A sorting domain-containing protein [Dyadobacter sp. CY345]MCF2444356.1 T9SS type A sorting domain-containing protein [Dyadobacter sp. CY345]